MRHETLVNHALFEINDRLLPRSSRFFSRPNPRGHLVAPVEGVSRSTSFVGSTTTCRIFLRCQV
jgi:hypothetical protein